MHRRRVGLDAEAVQGRLVHEWVERDPEQQREQPLPVTRRAASLSHPAHRLPEGPVDGVGELGALPHQGRMRLLPVLRPGRDLPRHSEDLVHDRAVILGGRRRMPRRRLGSRRRRRQAVGRAERRSGRERLAKQVVDRALRHDAALSRWRLPARRVVKMTHLLRMTRGGHVPARRPPVTPNCSDMHPRKVRSGKKEGCKAVASTARPRVHAHENEAAAKTRPRCLRQSFGSTGWETQARAGLT